jgi:hypothetical protein
MEKWGEEEWTGVRQAWGKWNNIWVFGGIFFGLTPMKSFFAPGILGNTGHMYTNKILAQFLSNSDD